MSGVKKAAVSFRIGTAQWVPEKRFRELLGLFEQYQGVTDEITFLTSETHPPLPLEVIKKRAILLTERMAEVRKKGYKTGVNILATIGHHNENLPNSLSGDYTHMTDIDGNVCLGSFCPNDENMREYIKQVYEIIARTNPDYIWIDDDVRLFNHMPIICGCFCDNCLAIFESEFGVRHTRESLKKVFNADSLNQKLKARKDWLEHNRNTISRLFRLIERTVHNLKPDLPLGFMTSNLFFEGYDFDKWAGILSGSGNVEVLWRPGGGFYSDECLMGLAGKAHDIGRQVSLLPDSVISIQSEIENFPYQRLKKSARATVLEAASHIASGCTGAAFNVLSMYDEPLNEYVPLIAKLKDARLFYDLLVQYLERCKPLGVYTGWGKDTFAANNAAEGNWFDETTGKIDDAHVHEIFEIGIPAAYSFTQASVTLLSGDNVLVMKDNEILRILSSGVYLDTQALTRLNEMGYGKFTGFTVERVIHDDGIEEFTGHALNGDFAGRRRDGRQSFSFWHSPAGVLQPLLVESQILARIVDYTGGEVAPCCMGIFENRLGGRICVAGYYPWRFLQNLAKSTQVRSLMRWLSGDTLPAYIASFHKANIWVRELRGGGLAVAVLNSCLDAAEKVILMLRTRNREITVFNMACAETRVRSYGTDGCYQQFVLPAIGAWEMVLVVSEVGI